MRLFLLRHSKAKEASLLAFDAKRKLTAEGKTLAFRRAQKFRKKLDHIEVIFSSPFPRALETAEIFASVLGKENVLSELDLLDTSGQPLQILKMMSKLKNQQNILLVGHEPWMSKLASLLISGSQNTHIRIKKCGLCIIEVHSYRPSGGRLLLLR